MNVYVVSEIMNTESCETEVVRVYSTRADAEAYVKRHNYTWKSKWTGEEREAFTIEEWVVETDD